MITATEIKSAEQYALLLLELGARGEGIRIHLPKGAYRNVPWIDVDPFMLQVPGITESQLPEYLDAEAEIASTDIHMPVEIRSAARVLRTRAEYNANPNRTTRRKLREYAGVLERNMMKALEYRVKASITSARDSENMSSMLAVGVPAWNEDYFIDDKLRFLELGWVVISGNMARKMSVADGDYGILAGQPITEFVPARIRVIEGYHDHVIGVSPGAVEFIKQKAWDTKDLHKILSGDDRRFSEFYADVLEATEEVGELLTIINTHAERLGRDFDGDMLYLIKQACPYSILHIHIDLLGIPPIIAWLGARDPLYMAVIHNIQQP